MKLRTTYTDVMGQVWEITKERDIEGRPLFYAQLNGARICTRSMEKMREILDATE